MGKLRYSSRVTRRNFLARSGHLAGAAPAVTLLLSSASIPGAAIANYVDVLDFPVLRRPADSDTTETPVPFPNTGQSSGLDAGSKDVKVDGHPNQTQDPGNEGSVLDGFSL